jgi:hypothetical protein
VANTSVAFGFSASGTIGGSTPNFRISKRLIASTNATAIYHGDAVMPVTSTATGYIQQYATGSVPCCGVFLGCKYLSISRGFQVPSQFWPGSDANGDVTAYVIDDPQAEFLVASGYSGGPITPANIDQNVSIISSPVGNNYTGLSGMTIGQPATTSTYPFTVTRLLLDPPGVNGTDDTTAYNWCFVTFNNEIFRTGNTSIS